MVLFQDIIKVALSEKKIHLEGKRQKSNLRRGSFCPAYKVQIITGDILDGFLQGPEDREDDQYEETKPPGTTQCWTSSVMIVMIPLIMIMIRSIIRAKGNLVIVVLSK